MLVKKKTAFLFHVWDITFIKSTSSYYVQDTLLKWNFLQVFIFYIFYMNEVPNKINFCENCRSIYNRILFVLNEKYSWKAIRMRHAENADEAASQARN